MSDLPIVDLGPEDPSRARPAFFPVLKLRRSKNSETVAVRYHANTSEYFGKGSSLSLYIEPWHLPDPPEEIEVMIYRDAPPAVNSDFRVVYQLTFHSAHGTTYRYDECADRTRVGSVYVPKLILDNSPPQRCFLCVDYPKTSRAPIPDESKPFTGF